MPYQARTQAQADADYIHRQLGGQVVALRVDWANRLSSIHAALVLQQLLFEARHHADDEGWFFVTAEDMQEHTAVGSRAYHTARGVLVDANLIETKRAGVPAKTYIRFRSGPFKEWVTFPDNSMPADLDSATAETSFDDRRNKTLRPQELIREVQTRDQNESAIGDMQPEQVASPESTKPKPPRKTSTAIDDDFWPASPGIEKWATENHVALPAIHAEVPKFIDHHAAKGSRMVDWDRAFYTWLRNAKSWGHLDPIRTKPTSRAPGKRGYTADELMADYFNSLREGD